MKQRRATVRDLPGLLSLEQLLPSAAVVPFDAEAAGRAAMIHSAVGRARGRASDIAIAACAQLHEAAIWTLNQEDFRDIPGLDFV